MMKHDERLVGLLADAIYDGLRKTSPRDLVSGRPAPHERTLIDGQFLLRAVARRILRELGPALQKAAE
jgi:hypothetical protein